MFTLISISRCHLLSFCFFTCTATTKIYTYVHSLSLHDALPICCPRQPWRQPDRPSACARRQIHFSPLDHARLSCRGRDGSRRLPGGRRCSGDHSGVPGHVRRHRSEEHTSELQSLMRISYAVFCLNKKKQQDENDIHHE